MTGQVFRVPRPASRVPFVSPRRLSRLRGARLDDAAIAALALLKFQDRLEEMALAEVRPESRSDPDLGVRDLPQQEVGDAHLPARADEQIRIRQAGRSQPRPERLLVDLLGRETPGGNVVGERPAGIDDLRAA